MASIEADALKGMLQSLEHTLSALDAASAAATQLITAQWSGNRCRRRRSRTTNNNSWCSPSQREHMRTVIARWWTLLEDRN